MGAILNSARNWQDTTQAVMPGYTERIVRIHLKKDEGGLNLKMPKALIEALGDLGGFAGDELLDFDFDEHRWRRLLAATAALEKSFEDLNTAYFPKFQEFLHQYQENHNANGPTGSYIPRSSIELQKLLKRWKNLASLAKSWADDPLRDNWGEDNTHMPKPRATIRFTPVEFSDPEQ